MLKVEDLSYSFPQKDLYHKISFTIEEDRHAAFIGSNGTGKSTLVDMLMQPEEYLYDGKITLQKPCRIGYVSQFAKVDKTREVTVFDYLSEEFVRLQQNMDRICEQMAETEELDALMEEYQRVLDESSAIDADNYESNIKKQLKLAQLADKEQLSVLKLSGGEYKLVQVIREMLVKPDLLIMDEPDVFLDFENLNALRDLINQYRGTMLVITHNRYLLNNCFDKILHLENMELQEFDGNYIEYNFALLQTKIELQELAAADTAEIERNEKLVERIRAEATKFDNATIGRTLHAKVTQLERLKARRIKEPFVDIRKPEILLSTTKPLTEQNALTLTAYSVSFDKDILENVSFEIGPTDKVAIVGQNGAGKTTLLRDIYKNDNSSIVFGDEVEISFLSQMQGEMLNEEHTVYEEFEELGFETEREIREFLSGYCLDEEAYDSKIAVLSGGEKNLLQLAKISAGDANLLLLDEPTSHLDTYSQIALEQAVAAYQGAVLMVSHDFYTIVNCADYVLLIENQTVRKISMRKFRKMIYANHFEKDYLELEQKKKELETRVSQSLKNKNFEQAKKQCDELETVIKQM